ncbi:hypothetical protein ACJMK2_031449 [Sinanodonta woodiana]|uniref:Glutamate receptor n=1 Tax=Sinanodonta woodiana TaxID=1069815 RepID=A0ABD3X0Y2_SINWO
MAEGIFALIVDNHPMSYATVQSYAQNMRMPTLIPMGTGSSPYDDYNYDISMLPSTTEAIADVIRHFRWSVVYYLFDSNDGLLRLEKMFELFRDPTKDQVNLIIRARRITNASDCYELLRKIDRYRKDPVPLKRIILDLSSIEAYEKVLHQIVDVGMNREDYHYILGGLGINEISILNTFIYGGVNITGFSIVDRDDPENIKLLKAAEQWSIVNLGAITTDEALMIDTLRVIANVLNQMDLSRNNLYYGYGPNYGRSGAVSDNVYVGSNCCNCSDNPVNPKWDGQQVLASIKRVKTRGLTGNIEFDEHGMRKNYVFKVHQLEHKQRLRQVGNWTPSTRFSTQLLPTPNDPFIIPAVNRTQIITTIMAEPFVQERRTADKNGAPLVDGRYLEGYCIDLAKKVQEQCSTPFEYTFKLVSDNGYGNWDKDTGTWNGMIGEMINGVADMAVAPLTITKDRQRVVDFTKPFMMLGISIMIKKPDKQKPGVFSFMYPLSNRVWLCVMIAFVTVSLILFLVGRWSPYEWTKDGSKGGSPTNTFTLFNTFWFSLGALMQQGSDIFPRSYSGRIVGSAWWFFTLILISSYTANLAAFLTIERLLPPIKSADDLLKHPEIEYGTLKTGSSRTFFETSLVPTYAKMWQFMNANFDKVMKDEVQQGVEQVQTSKGKYAFLLESTWNIYWNQRKPCKTMKVGDNLDSKGYGIATAQGHFLRTPLNIAVLNLREIGELHKLEQKWWYAKGECGMDSKDASTSALTLSHVSGIFHILVGGLVLAMCIALIEFFIHRHIRIRKKKQVQSTGVRIVKKQPMEALKEVGYVEREQQPMFGESLGSSNYQKGQTATPLVMFESTSPTGTSHTKIL